MSKSVEYDFIQSISPEIILLLIFPTLLIILNIIFFVKLWNMTNDVNAICKLLQERLPKPNAQLPTSNQQIQGDKSTISD